MNAVLEQINSTGKAFVEFAVPMLVQSSALIVILLLVDFVLRKKVKAVFRYCIWMLVLVKLVLPTSLSSPLSLGYWFGDKLAYVAESRTAAAPEAEVVEPALADMLHIIEPVPIEVERLAPAVLPMMPDVEPAAAEAVSPPEVSVTPVTWQGVVFLLWLAVVIALGLLLLQRAMFVRGLVAQAKEANALVNDALEYCCKCMGVKRKVGLKVSANAASPAVCGLFRPVILLPHKLAPSLGSRGLRAVLLHELAHIRRGDLWVNLAQTVLQIAYFYNPLLWFANAMIRRVREQAIDETVLVAMGEKAQQYPQTLVNVAKLAFKRPVLSLRLIGVVESKSALAGRIKHILNRPMPKSAKIGIVGVLAVIIAAAILLPMAAARQRDGWADKDLLIKFTEQEPSEPKVVRSAGKATWQKSYDVEFAPWEELLVVAELYQAGKPMRQLGQKVFSGSSDAQTFSVNFVRTYKNDAKTIVGHSGTVELGDEVLEIAEFTVNTQRYFSGEGWGGYHGDGLRRTRARYTKKEYAELKALFYYHSTDGGRVDEGEANFWIPGHNVTPTGSHHCVVLKMIPLSRLEYLVCEPVGGWQGLDGKTIPVDFTADRAEAIADKYKQMIVDSVEQQWAAEKQADMRAGSLEHFVGKYAMAKHPDKAAFEITKKGDVFIFSDPGGPKFEMEEAEDGLKFADGGGERFRVRYDASKNVYYLDNLGIPGKEWEPESILLTKISAKKTNAIFAATLSNGVTVELVGVTNHYIQSERPVEQAWWSANGLPLESQPYTKLGWSSITDYRNSNYEFAIRLDGREEYTYAAETSLSRSRRFPNIPKTKNDESLPNMRAFIGEFRKEDKEGNIRFGVAAGPWQEVEVWRDGWTGGEAYNVSTHSKSSVVYEWPRQDGNKVVIEVTHTLANEDRRLLIVDKDGKIHIGDGRKFMGEGAGIVRDIHYFHNLNRKDMEVLKFEKRPYEWVEFKNVSLRPGHKTDVQVEGEGSKGQGKLRDQEEPTYGGRSLTELVSALSDHDFQTKINAVYHLGYIGPKAKPAVPALVNALNQEPLRESVLHSLGNIGVGAEEAIPALMKAIAEYPSACRWHAAVALANIGNGAVASLEKGTKSEKMYLRIWCNAALAKQKEFDSPNLRYLAKAMKSSDRSTSVEAVRALTMLGPISTPLVPDFIEALKQSNVPEKDVAFALAQIGQDAKAAVPELVKMIQSTNPSTQRDAIYALSAIGGEDAAPAVASLIQALASKDKLVRREAANALGNIGLPASTAIEQLANILKDEDEFVRQNAAQALGKIDLTNLEPVPALIVAMKDESGRVRVAVAQTLLKIGPVDKEVILAFINAADDNWKGVRYACDTFFTYLGPQHSYVIPDLIEMLKTPNERAQRLAITALGNMGEAAVPAVPYLAKNIKNPRLESVAFGALRKLGPKAGAAVPGLIEMLEDKRKRFSAALVLEAIGPAAWQAIPALQNCLGQGPQVTFARALLAIDPKSAKAADELVRIAESPYVPNQWTEQPDAHYLLVKYGHDKDRHLQGLIDALENPNPRIRLSAAAYLGKLGAEANKAVDSLQRALKDDDPEARVEAAHAILMLGPSRLLRKQAVDVILSSLDGKETMTQVRAAGALQSFGPEEKWVVPALIAKIHARELRTRKAVVEALGNIGPGAKEALPFLKRLLKDEDWWIRQSAAQAIKKIDNKTDVQVEGGSATKTRLLSAKERAKTDRWVSITGSVENTGWYLFDPDAALRLSELVMAAGYNANEADITYLDVDRQVEKGGKTIRLFIHRNLEAILKGAESNPLLERQDAVMVYKIVPNAKKDREFEKRFGPPVELVVKGGMTKRDIFVDFDLEKLLSLPDDLDRRPKDELSDWMRKNGIDAWARMAPEIAGLVGFDMVVLSVDNHYWGLKADEIVDHLLIKNFKFPVLMRAESDLPATYLIKTREYGLGILQILAFTKDPQGVRIRYKMLQKASDEKPDVQVEGELASFAQECAGRIMEACHQEQPKQDYINYITESLIYHIDSNDLTGEKKEQRIKSIIENIKERFDPNLGHNLAIAGFSDRMIVVDIYNKEKKTDVEVEGEEGWSEDVTFAQLVNKGTAESNLERKNAGKRLRKTLPVYGEKTLTIYTDKGAFTVPTKGISLESHFHRLCSDLRDVDDSNEVIVRLENFAQDHPEHNVAAWAHLKITDILLDKEGADSAIEKLKWVAVNFPKAKKKLYILLGWCPLTMYEEWKDYVEKYPILIKDYVWFRIAEIYEKSKKPQKALEAYNHILSTVEPEELPETRNSAIVSHTFRLHKSTLEKKVALLRRLKRNDEAEKATAELEALYPKEAWKKIALEAAAAYLSYVEESRTIKKQKEQWEAAQNQIDRLLGEYKEKNKCYSENLDWLDTSLSRDVYNPEGKDYRYELIRGGYIISSCGRDGTYGNDDDLLWIAIGNFHGPRKRGELKPVPDVQVEVEGAGGKSGLVWGEAVEGVQMRVRPERQRWYEGETPKFIVDMRNKGMVELELVLAQEHWEVELDGLWYRAGASFSGISPTLLLGPGQEHKDIEFYPGVWSRWNINGKPLKFTPGLHTVRLSFGPNTRDRANWRRLRVVSNAVVIEVLPAEADKRGWGEAVAGLQCGLRADKRLWKADETPRLQAVARNVGRGPWRLPRPSELFYLKVAGKIWRWKGPVSDRPADLEPREALDKTTILLSEDWVGAYGSDLRLKLSPGKHTIQLVMFVTEPVPRQAPPRTRPIPKHLRIESNVVVVEVLPDGEKADTVGGEADAATALQAELYELWRQRDSDIAGAEAFGKKLLEKYTKREEQSLVYYQLAEIYAQSGQISPSKTIEYARAGWWYLHDSVKKARLFVYWGDALQLSKGRREAAKIYLRGLEFCLQFALPRDKPERPAVGRYRVDGPPEVVEEYRRKNQLEMAAWKQAKRIEDLIQHRQALTGQVVQLYAQEPDAFDELRELVMKYLHSEEAAEQLIAAARAYRRNQKVAIPVIMRMGPDPKPDADLLWGQAAEGIRVRLRAERGKWAAGETPKFKVDVRNDGSHRLLLTSAPDYWGVEVDGVWYRVTIPMLGGAKGMSFGPDKRWYNLELSLDMALGSQNENGGVELAPGRHTVRAALSKGLSEDGGPVSIRAVSNPVEIEILPAESGVKVEGEKPTIRVDVITDKPAVVLDIDTGDKMQLLEDWPEEYDVAWDNDGGGAIFSKRGGSVTILPIYGVKDFEDAVRSPFSKTVELGEGDGYGVFAKDSRYVWVKTSEGNIAVVEIQNYSPARAMLKWQIIKQNPDVPVEVKRSGKSAGNGVLPSKQESEAKTE